MPLLFGCLLRIECSLLTRYTSKYQSYERLERVENCQFCGNKEAQCARYKCSVVGCSLGISAKSQNFFDLIKLVTSIHR
jgi:hypothetical protein